MKETRTLFIWLIFTVIAVGLALDIQQKMVYSAHRAELTKQVQQRSLDIYTFSNKGAIMGAAIQMGLTSDRVKQRIAGAITPDDTDLQAELDAVLQQYHADSVFIVNREGIVVGTHNRNPQLNSLGISVKHRPYWIRGILGIPNVYPGISMIDHERGLFFATPIYQSFSDQSAVVGVFAIRINAAELDQKLQQEQQPAALTSPDGLVFAANQPDWIAKLAEPITRFQQQRLVSNQQFADLFNKTPPAQLPFQLTKEHVALNGKIYAVNSAPISWPDQHGAWRVVLLQDTADWLPLWQQVVLGSAITCGLLALYWIWQLQRRLKDDTIANIQANRDIQKKAKRHLLDISNALPLAIFQLKQRDSEHLQYIYASANTNEILGLESWQLLTNHQIMEEIVHPDDLSWVLTIFWEAIESKRDFECQHRIMRNNDIRWIKVKAVCSYKEELDWIWNGYWMDVTNSHQQTELLREAKEAAEAATRTKSMFLANMSHEIRTPMNAVIGLAYLALKTDLTPKQHDYLTKIHQAGSSLLGIINDILDFSKIEANQLTLENITFNLDDVLANLSLVSSQRAHEKGLELLFDLAPDVPRGLIGDPLRLSQILINLISNAVKFTEQGYVHLQVRQLSRHDQFAELQFVIRDTGIGMTSEQLKHVFQAFTQADGSTTRRFGGTGLGLAITRHLVEQMQGTISVESQPNIGSQFSFTITLPINGQAHDQRRLIPNAITGLRILVVDDNPVACHILLNALQMLPVKAEAVTQPEMAWHRLQQAAQNGTPFHLLMTDWQMPELDGITLAKQARSLRQPPRIVLVTAFSYDDVQTEAQQVGIEGFLAKPISQSQVVDCLMRLFAPPQGETKAQFENLALPTFQNTKVLLVEDNLINQQIALELMQASAIAADVAANGLEALSLLLSHDPDYYDLVFMDLQMPGMDGHETTIALRADARFAQLPIIAMTAHAQEDERQRCLAEGMNDHLTKPIDPPLFYKLLSHYLSHKLDGYSATSTPPKSPFSLTLLGLDSQSALQRLNGNQKLYLQLLQQYCQEQCVSMRQIRQLLTEQQTAAAKPLLHSLKGVSANIGAMSIAAQAAQLEQAIAQQQAHHELLPLISQLDDAMHQLCHQINAATAEENRTTVAATAVTDVQFAALMTLIENYDCSALDRYAELEAGLQLYIPAFELHQINTHLQAFDFDLALARLARFPITTTAPDASSSD